MAALVFLRPTLEPLCCARIGSGKKKPFYWKGRLWGGCALRVRSSKNNPKHEQTTKRPQKSMDSVLSIRPWAAEKARKNHKAQNQETTKDPEIKGSRSYHGSATPLFRGTKAPKTLVLLCFGAIREGRMIRDRSLLTS